MTVGPAVAEAYEIIVTPLAPIDEIVVCWLAVVVVTDTKMDVLLLLPAPPRAFVVVNLSVLVVRPTVVLGLVMAPLAEGSSLEAIESSLAMTMASPVTILLAVLLLDVVMLLAMRMLLAVVASIAVLLLVVSVLVLAPTMIAGMALLLLVLDESAMSSG